MIVSLDGNVIRTGGIMVGGEVEISNILGIHKTYWWTKCWKTRDRKCSSSTKKITFKLWTNYKKW
ncbi:hypothetical protein NWE58_03445 [Mycoplasmopsis felis]|nr:hypothetical protein [Mycoplasmopsis felis]UWV84460.1 hypothetical protein NWE58_03445 [Mycoplasmopsis felis]